MADFKKDHPDIPLNTFIEEDVPVQKIKFDSDTKKISRVTELEKKKVMYIEAPYKKMRCQPGTHIFKVLDTHKYLFGCVNCKYKTKVNPVYFSFDSKTGYLTSKTSGNRV